MGFSLHTGAMTKNKAVALVALVVSLYTQLAKAEPNWGYRVDPEGQFEIAYLFSSDDRAAIYFSCLPHRTPDIGVALSDGTASGDAVLTFSVGEWRRIRMTESAQVRRAYEVHESPGQIASLVRESEVVTLQTAEQTYVFRTAGSGYHLGRLAQRCYTFSGYKAGGRP